MHLLFIADNPVEQHSHILLGWRYDYSSHGRGNDSTTLWHFCRRANGHGRKGQGGTPVKIRTPGQQDPKKSSRSFAIGVITLLLFSLLACQRSSPSTPTVPPLAQEIILYDWEVDMPQSVLDAFTAEYGVQVRYLTYETQEEALDNIRAGNVYDVLVLENRLVPVALQEGLLATIDYRHVPNFKNVSANFRDLVYDPKNEHTVPYSWGTTALVVRSDLVTRPITRWADLWDSQYAGRVGIWRGESREVLSMTLKSLGYSANSENPTELQAALARLKELKPNIVFLEDLGAEAGSGVPPLLDGRLVLEMGWSYDALEGREQNPAITYVMPEEGALLWGDNFVIPLTSQNKYTAELFINFLLRPEITAQIIDQNYYAMPNEQALSFVNPQIRNDPAVFPLNESLVKAEVILPLSVQGQQLYDDIWSQFIGTVP